MVKLLSVKKIADSSSEIKYELKYKQAGVSKSMVIKENRHWVEDIQEYISTINSEDSTFYELWGYLKFRRAVCQAMKQENIKNTELQAAQKNLGDLRFEITFKHNKKTQTAIITQKNYWVAEISENISTINSEMPEFYDIWGQSLSFRKEVCRAINQENIKNTELQAA